jgi:hypothetical protein
MQIAAANCSSLQASPQVAFNAAAVCGSLPTYLAPPILSFVARAPSSLNRVLPACHRLSHASVFIFELSLVFLLMFFFGVAIIKTKDHCVGLNFKLGRVYGCIRSGSKCGCVLWGRGQPWTNGGHPHTN